MAVAHGPLQLWVEGVVEADHAQISADGEPPESRKTNSVQTIALRGVISRRHESPQAPTCQRTDGWRHAEPLARAVRTGITWQIERGFGYRILAAKAGNIARLQEILDWIPGTVFESQNTLSHCGGGHQPCDEGCIAPAASLVMGVNVGLPNAG